MRTGPSDTIRRLAWWRRQDDHRSPPGPDPDTSGNPFHRSLERALEIAQQIGSATYSILDSKPGYHLPPAIAAFASRHFVCSLSVDPGVGLTTCLAGLSPRCP